MRLFKRFARKGLVKLGEGGYPCRVGDLTRTGANLVLDYPRELPDKFSLQLTLPSGQEVRSCRLIWKGNVEAGVAFE